MRIVWHVKSLLFVLAAFVGAGAIVNAHFEKLPLAEAFYFAVITGLTVDYGDIAPRTAGVRITAIMIVLNGVIFPSVRRPSPSAAPVQ